MGTIYPCKCNKDQEKNEMDLEKEKQENEQYHSNVNNSEMHYNVDNINNEYTKNLKQDDVVSEDILIHARAIANFNNTDWATYQNTQVNSIINKEDGNSYAENTNENHSNGLKISNFDNNPTSCNQLQLQVINEINPDLSKDSIGEGKSACPFRENNYNNINHDEKGGETEEDKKSNNYYEMTNYNNVHDNIDRSNMKTSDVNHHFFNNKYNINYNLTNHFKNIDDNFSNENNSEIENNINNCISSNQPNQKKLEEEIVISNIGKITKMNKDKNSSKLENNKLSNTKFDIKLIIPESKIWQSNEDDALFFSELKKQNNSESTTNSINFYSDRFCMITKNEFRYYISREQYLKNQKPFMVIPYFQIVEANIVVSNLKSQQMDHFYIRFLKVQNQKRMLQSRNLKFHSQDYEASKSNVNKFSKSKKMSLLDIPNVISNSQICKDLENMNHYNNSLTENVLIFSSDKVDLVHKWVLVLNYFINNNLFSN